MTHRSFLLLCSCCFCLNLIIYDVGHCATVLLFLPLPFLLLGLSPSFYLSSLLNSWPGHYAFGNPIASWSQDMWQCFWKAACNSAPILFLQPRLPSKPDTHICCSTLRARGCSIHPSDPPFITHQSIHKLTEWY